MLKYILLLTACLAACVTAREVCYGDLGCFNDKWPFSGTIQRPLAFLPDSPQKIATKFTLFSSKNLKGEVINADILGETYDATKETKFIVHGFLHNAIKVWVIDLKNALLEAGDFNVITVDWSRGNGLPYTQATANTQVTGAEIAKLISSMVNKRNARPRDFHCIGHSLGSHVCGYAGARIPGMGRISGLDPAGPYFENTPAIVRLDPTDALFVDALHSDGTANLLLGLGMMQDIGHVDFYPNG
jgi:pimeloyl-ACP methyl ester carboxylesterase